MGEERVDQHYKIKEKPIIGFQEEEYDSSEEHHSKWSCDDYCHHDTCKDYKDRMKYYKYCKKCATEGLCWNLSETSCHECSVKDSINCEDSNKFGCWNELAGKYTKPINPKYTGCKLCWR